MEREPQLRTLARAGKISEDVLLDRGCGSLQPVRKAQLGEDIGGMGGDGPVAHREGLSDLPVGASLNKQLQDVEFTATQPALSC